MDQWRAFARRCMEMAAFFVLLGSTAGSAVAAEKYRVTVPAYGNNETTNPAMCNDEAQPWYSTPQEACQGAAAVHPNCDRYSAVYAGHVATLVTPTTCFVSWNYRNAGSPIWSSFSATWGLSLCSQNGLCASGNTPEPEAGGPSQAGMCAGNPIVPATGEKLQHEHDYSDSGADPLHLVRTFKSSRGLGPAAAQDAGLGRTWSHNHAVFVRQSPPAVDCATRYFVPPQARGFKAAARLQACQLYAGSLDPAWVAQMHDGSEPNAGAYLPTGDYCKIHKYLNGAHVGTIFGVRTIDAGACGPVGYSGITAEVVFGDGTARSFQKDPVTGNWLSLDAADTLTLTDSGLLYRRHDDDSTFQFDAKGRLLSVTQRNGWVRTYTYSTSSTPPNVAPAPGLLIAVTNQFGRSLLFAYNAAGQLSGITAPDEQAILYHYESTSPGARLTAVIGGAAGADARTYRYDNAAYPQLLTGIDESGVRLASFAYDGLGRAISTQHAQGADLHSVAYGNGFATVTDPLGTQRTFSYGTAHGKLVVTGATQPTGRSDDAASRVQDANGFLASETDYLGIQTFYTWEASRRLPVSVTRASGRPEARTTETQWHPNYRLPLQIRGPGRSTTFTYDQAGNKLTETVADTGTGAARTWSWTWNAQGLVTSATDPNNRTWQYAYDGVGNLEVETNPLGQLTRYTHDAGGRVLSRTAPNGLFTSYAYDSRGRLLSADRAGERTTYAYASTGLLESVRLPNGHQIAFRHDTARRLVGWSDNRGANGVYVLDAMGNRTSEQLRDAAGNLVWQLARTINAVNRVANETLGGNQSLGFGYDANADLSRQTNGLGQSTSYSIDGLRRVIAVTDAANARATLAYDALDGITAAADFKGATTTYARNAFGEATGESSADIGSRATRHDAAGLPTEITDALGQVTTIQRDGLGRPTQLTFADGAATLLRYDLTGPDFDAPGTVNASRGHLSEVQDRSGTTKWQRDIFGRVTRKVQTMPNVGTFTAGYSYNAQGLPDSLTYPTGGQLKYRYSPAGQLIGLDWNGSPLVNGITWNALGLPTGWTWAFAAPLAASRSYDTAGRVTATEISSYGYDAAGRITSLAQQLGQPAGSDPLGTGISFVTIPFSVAYDAVGRITSFGNASANTTFSYDANGNRLRSVMTEGADIQKREYTVDGDGNRLLGFAHTASGTAGTVSAVVTYGYNANGDLTSDGLRHYAYDAEGRLSSMAAGSGDTAPVTRYAHNALGQRVFKTDPAYVIPVEQDEGLLKSIVTFFSRMFSPKTQEADQLGFAYVYDEDGSLLSEIGTGGAHSTGSTNYVWLPTPRGPMPVAAIINGSIFAVHADHLNTPRRLTDSSGRPVWQWKFSAFGDEEPRRAAHRFAHPSEGFTTNVPDVVFNLRYPGQYADRESGLHYNYFRSYSPRDGARYTQPDPIGLRGGWNRFSYVRNSPLMATDPTGLLEFNKPPPATVPPEGETFAALVCLETCLKGTTGNLNLNLLATGGAEKGGHSSKSHHYKGEACDIAGPKSNKGVTDADAKMCAKACGFGAGHFETFPNNPNRDHWHFQLTPGNGVPAL
ncbi:RHS repeat protein [Ramlibacter henchirensis]|uniref:RHS repeat protein n=1 Tax=Ramlibacter henchirensis TaxID=204072 RepID=A0A4Z0C656_9BURK|nr:RHS repeat-associated core domain-containing protein [Ramlibacter henchirensis]TFZ05535.1 RHS repeat protein [Ramlibacter henchirensis]